MENAQKIVSDNVKARGYYDGFTLGQLAARHIAKLQEELGELAEAVDLPGELRIAINAAAAIARTQFDDLEKWKYPTTTASYKAQVELSDVEVVTLSLAEILNRIGQRVGRTKYDVIELAVGKSANDVKRGVRKAETV